MEWDIAKLYKDRKTIVLTRDTEFISTVTERVVKIPKGTELNVLITNLGMYIEKAEDESLILLHRANGKFIEEHLDELIGGAYYKAECNMLNTFKGKIDKKLIVVIDDFYYIVN